MASPMPADCRRGPALGVQPPPGQEMPGAGEIGELDREPSIDPDADGPAAPPGHPPSQLA